MSYTASGAGRGRPGRLRRSVRLARGACVVVGVLAVAGPAARGADDERVLPSRMAIGVTHTQYAPDRWNPAPAVSRAVSVLRTSVDIQNQALMGWGADDPEPRPGVFDWRSLDRRIDLMRRTPRSVLALTLCGAPDWMKGGVSGTTEWSALEKAPRPDHYGDFAALAATAARRYPDVKYFLVWNELKGFYSVAVNDWDVGAYTDLYNRVYQAVKAVRPDAKVGGPYVPMDSWADRAVMSHPSAVAGSWGVADGRSLAAVEFWLRHKVGADFLVVDGASKPKGTTQRSTDRDQTAKFADITRWLRRRTELPIWWAEFYAVPSDETLPSRGPRRVQLLADALARVAAAGAQAVLIWQPEERSTSRNVALWTATTGADGGRPLPTGGVLAWLRRNLGRGCAPTVDYAGATLLLAGPGCSLSIDELGDVHATSR